MLYVHTPTPRSATGFYVLEVKGLGGVQQIAGAAARTNGLQLIPNNLRLSNTRSTCS
jgi:hypothetical protein